MVQRSAAYSNLNQCLTKKNQTIHISQICCADCESRKRLKLLSKIFQNKSLNLSHTNKHLTDPNFYFLLILSTHKQTVVINPDFFFYESINKLHYLVNGEKLLRSGQEDGNSFLGNFRERCLPQPTP